ncbi:hypothetical protein CM15mP43_06100 [bacterium]|nr:MAG: hypothetical protein CM15mP43_06100 [bacterium]
MFECNIIQVYIFEDSVKICPRKKIINLYNSSNIPSRFSKCRNTTLDNGSWEIRERSIQDALEYSVKYIKNFPNLLPPFLLATRVWVNTSINFYNFRTYISLWNKMLIQGI